MNKNRLTVLGLLAISLVAVFVARYSILGGVTASATLSSAPALTGVVAQSLYSGRGNTVLPTPNVDFSLKNVHYFDNNDWVIASVTPTRNQFDASVVVLEKLNGSYEVVLGPGSAFDSSLLIGMPASAGQYLKSQGIIYDPVD